MFMNALLSGLTLGGVYALVAMGLTIQYGVSRSLNLGYGEFLIGAAFAVYVLFGALGISPYLLALVVVPVAFGLSWLIYRVMLTPILRRARTPVALEIDSLLLTFGLLFAMMGIMLLVFGSNYTSYTYLSVPVRILDATVALNRLVSFGAAVVVGALAFAFLMRTRTGMALRAVAVDPVGAQLVGIDVKWAAGLAFAIGGAIAALGGVLISTYMTFTAEMGVVFTMKALIVVIMAGVGHVVGALLVGLALGLIEAFVAAYLDPGLTVAVIYAVFLLALIVRPVGIFGRAVR
ncbi:branched-chain amino acid transport system permease protein [Lutimaribacter pacificus]|uniref:Amino acid/amide ABC transporter membrane protein 1, HAAT family n=1 Tax=Lutimaribacter pacificus TaxID=391948 RepID=A0A1H0L6Y8_9RHOB|nr:branched-chain amino acid ABC transporter permease [Lutimaribacter pacificus]SDO63988.1 branched-chain amino acid transport system permease protein [Lutimaribacter pacificus]SHK70344.1 amino acid/amide ABC transporter membrane protein 1, HAAT family [Lutimaribacter pacificus]